jgi:hypothetical protein
MKWIFNIYQNKDVILTFPELYTYKVKYGFTAPEEILYQIEHKSVYLNREDAERCNVLHPLCGIIYKRNKDNYYAIKEHNKTLSILFPEHIYNSGNYNNILDNHIEFRLSKSGINNYLLYNKIIGAMYYPELSVKHIIVVNEVVYNRCKYIKNENNVLYLSKDMIYEKYMSFDKYSRKYIDYLYEGGKNNGIT